MKKALETLRQNGTEGLYSRRKFLKRALMTAAYVAPVVVSYPSTVFAFHPDCPTPMMFGMTMPNEQCMGTLFGPGCSML